MEKLINVTRSSLPEFEEFCREIAPIWESRWLTNMGEKHQALQKALEERMDVPHVTLYTNGHLALENMIEALSLKGEIIKKIIGVIVLAVTVRYGVYAMALSLIFTSIINQIINTWPNKKLLDYPYLQQLRDMLPSILLSCLMGLCVYPIQWLGWSDWIVLPLQLICGVGVYVLGSLIFRLDSFGYLLSTVKKLLHKAK